MAEAGLLGALIPAEYGGTGLGLLGMALALEEFSRHGLPNGFCVLSSMAAMALLRGGTPDQKARWLPAIATGSCQCAFAITEPDAGTNTFRMRTRAVRDGELYRLNGSKGWITGADVADYILVVARTLSEAQLEARGLPKSAGLGLFLVDANARGLDKQRMNTIGLEGYRQFMLYFDAVEVPAAQRIGPEHRGAAVLFQALNPERILIAAALVGLSEFALAKAVAYAGSARCSARRPSARIRAYSTRWRGSRSPRKPPACSPTRRPGCSTGKRRKPVTTPTWPSTWRRNWPSPRWTPPCRLTAAAAFVRDQHLIDLWTSVRLV